MAQQVFKIADATKDKLISSGDEINIIKSMTIANIHSADATADLYLVSQVSTDITATLVYSAETVAATTASDTVTIDNGSGSASVADTDAFLNERVYKADGTFIGICTAVTTTLLTFSGGLENAITDNDILYVGTRYYIFKSLVLPTGQTLKMDSNEVSFNNRIYSFYIKLAGTTPVDVIIN